MRGRSYTLPTEFYFRKWYTGKRLLYFSFLFFLMRVHITKSKFQVRVEALSRLSFPLSRPSAFQQSVTTNWSNANWSLRELGIYGNLQSNTADALTLLSDTDARNIETRDV